jgi:hypothetical protein
LLQYLVQILQLSEIDRRSGGDIPLIELPWRWGKCKLTGGMIDELPTARTMATTGFRWHVFCRSRRWSVNADFQKLINDGRGDVPLVKLRWRCGRCQSRLTDAVMDGHHFGTTSELE